MTKRGWICATIDALLGCATVGFAIYGHLVLFLIFFIVFFIYTFVFGICIGFNVYKFYPHKKAKEFFQTLLEVDQLSD
jgi:ABC-type multidrug transport system permease subunit